jgi:hypothetical protein
MANEMSPSASLLLRAEGECVEIRLDTAAAPHTLRALADLLPMALDLHCAKIAGDQVIFPVPFVLPLEGALSINAIPQAAFIYYPERQFCELMFGDLQDEEASVTPLGEAGAHIATLRRIGERLQAAQGRRIVMGELSLGPEADRLGALPSRPEGPAQSARVRAIRDARYAIWAGMPDEIGALMARRGIMLPVGPLLLAESEARKLHETLWLLRDRAGSGGFTAAAAAMLLRGAADRLANFAGLGEAGGFAARAAALLEASDTDARPILDELILWAGRLAGWLDLCIPWQGINAVTEEAAASLFPTQAEGDAP